MRLLLIILLYIIPSNGVDHHREAQIAQWATASSAWLREHGVQVEYSDVRTITFNEYIDNAFSLSRFLDGQRYAVYLETIVPAKCGERVGNVAAVYPSVCLGDDRWNALVLTHEVLHTLGAVHSENKSDIMYPIAYFPEYLTCEFCPSR